MVGNNSTPPPKKKHISSIVRQFLSLLQKPFRISINTLKARDKVQFHCSFDKSNRIRWMLDLDGAQMSTVLDCDDSLFADTWKVQAACLT